MILKTDPKLDLADLHDALLVDIHYDVSNPDERMLTLVLDGYDDSGFGRLRIQARNVFLFHYMAWGHMIGLESVNRWNRGVSPETQQDLERGRPPGLSVPPETYTVTFHSGSFIELVCERLQIEFLA